MWVKDYENDGISFTKMDMAPSCSIRIPSPFIIGVSGAESVCVTGEPDAAD
jgi:hypothetical protein